MSTAGNNLFIGCTDYANDWWSAGRGQGTIASSAPLMWTHYAKIAARILDLELQPVAILGLGFCILPRLLPKTWDVDIYEIEPEFISRYSYGRNTILGDFRDTLPAHGRIYSVIYNDTGVKFDVTPWLAPNGLLVPPEGFPVWPT